MKLPKLTNLSVTGTTVGDVHFPKVKTLLPLNGSNGGTSTTDVSNSNATVSFQGSSTTSTAQSKFGGSSLYVPNSNPEGIYFSGAGSTINLTGDFTVEYWIYRVQATPASNQIIGPMIGTQSISNNSTASNPYAMLIGFISSGPTNGQLWCSSNGSSWDVASGVDLGSGSHGTVGQWVHMALTRSSATWSYYVNGTRTYTGSLGSATIYTPGSYITLGKSYNTTNSFEAYYDDFRITQGLARYTGASFTVPTTAHLTSAGDVNKQIVVNSDADGVAIGTGGISQARIAKAWADIDGSQTAANMIASSYNISSITDNATGVFSFNFSTAMADANYSAVTSLGLDGGLATSVASCKLQDKTTALTKVRCTYRSSGAATDYDYNIICLIVFGN